METSRPGLGQVIRELREARAPKLSQEELGRRAGYRAGAGVSMSRIENGVTRPGPRRLHGIATALGVTVRELEARSAGRTPTTPSRPPTDPTGAPHSTDAPDLSDAAEPWLGERSGESTKGRLRRIQADVERRTTEAADSASAFNAAHDQARDDFFLTFLHVARTIEGLPLAHHPSTPSPPAGQAPVAPSTEAALRRLVVSSGVAAALASGAGAAAAAAETDPESAYDAVVATAILDAAPAAAHAEHPAGATARATRALLAGGSRTGGPAITAGALLTGFLASAASPLFAATTLIWLARRSREQNQQLRDELDRAETHLVETERGFVAVMDVLGRATARLRYLAVHGGHALGRWQAQLPSGPRAWNDLTDDDRRLYLAFVEVAACQISVDTINMTELLAATGPTQATLIQVADEILTLTQRDLERLV